MAIAGTSFFHRFWYTDVEMSRGILLSIIVAVALASCSLQKLIEPEQPVRNVKAYANPHTLCKGCHATDTPQAGPALFAAGTDPSTLCLSCHDYAQNHHPVSFAPSDPSRIPFPLYNGEIRCLTCHEIHGGPDHKGTPKLLRGGPYEDRRTICFKCHYREQYANINPHIMLTDTGKVRQVNGKPVCLLCHSRQPDPETDWTDTVGFRADVGFLCWRCHPPMPGIFFKQHFLVKPSKETLETMQETEERLIVTLPLVPRGRITCSTCHNPHQKGVIRHEAPAKGADALYKLRLPSICFACHRM
jgi:predicted CXXCH cytochrome family protein